MNNFTFNELNIGKEAFFERTITRKELNLFSKLSGNINPLHSNKTDKEYARNTEFGGIIVHGMLAASFFSTLLGIYLPGKYCLCLSQSIYFKKPIKLGQKLRICGKVIKKFKSLRIAEIETRILDANSKTLISGVARVRVLK